MEEFTVHDKEEGKIVKEVYDMRRALSDRKNIYEYRITRLYKWNLIFTIWEVLLFFLFILSLGYAVGNAHASYWSVAVPAFSFCFLTVVHKFLGIERKEAEARLTARFFTLILANMDSRICEFKIKKSSYDEQLSQMDMYACLKCLDDISLREWGHFMPILEMYKEKMKRK